MLANGRCPAAEPWIDLGAVRDTVRYIHDDVARSSRCARVREALAAALRELEALEPEPAAATASPPSNVVALNGLPRGFVRWTAGG